MNTRKVIRKIDRALRGEESLTLSDVPHIMRAIAESIGAFISGRPL